jgi:hypothetical protein
MVSSSAERDPMEALEPGLDVDAVHDARRHAGTGGRPRGARSMHVSDSEGRS